MKKFVAILLLSFLTIGCGFEPLYVEKKSNKKWYFGNEFDVSINSEMAKIKVEPIEYRFGQQIRNELVDILTPSGVPEEPKYKLHAEVTSKDVERQALRRDITATRERIRYVVTYYMTENGEQLFTADSVAYVSYDIMANPYSTTMAIKKAESDAAKIIANDMSLRVGAYFHSKSTKVKNSDI